MIRIHAHFTQFITEADGQHDWAIPETPPPPPSPMDDIGNPVSRVATDLENLEKSGNLKETSQSQGICDRIPKVREKSGNFAV